MSLLFRAAVLGGIAYLITRSMRSSTSSTYRRSIGSTGGSASPVGELHPGENNMWPTSESHGSTARQPMSANAGPGA